MRLSDGQRAGINLAYWTRSRQRITGKTLRGHLLWTAAEFELLAVHYPNTALLHQLMPHRSRKAITQAAQKRGLAKTLHRWTDENVIRLRALARAGATRSDFLAAFPELRWKQIQSALERRGIARARVPLRVYGEPVFDEVRRQARAHGLFIHDLAQLTRSGCYFRGRPARKNWKHLAAGIELFGCQVAVKWPPA